MLPGETAWPKEQVVCGIWLTLSHRDCSSSCPPKSQNMRRAFPTSTVPTGEKKRGEAVAQLSREQASGTAGCTQGSGCLPAGLQTSQRPQGLPPNHSPQGPSYYLVPRWW